MAGPAASRAADVEIRELAPAELRAAAGLLAEGMRDNPLHVAVFGIDSIRRERRLLRFFVELTRYVRANGVLLGAFAEHEMVGVLGMMAPGRCRPPVPDALRFAAALARNPPMVTLRSARWLMDWRRHDLREPHWHLGPMAVRPAFRRRGIARRMMTRCIEHIDARGAVGFLETDLAINAAFYETLGFALTRREKVLGIPTWFMRRASPRAFGA